jgi:hypothetical protein
MVNESFFTLACAGLIGILFGLALCFAGYRLFLILLPIWGFFFGLALGAQTIQAIFGQAFLATITSWVVGFIVGGIFAVLAYLFYIAAVAIIAGALGYTTVVGILLAIGLQMGFIVWLIGIVAGVLLAIVTLRFNLAKWIIIIATSVLGAATIVGAILMMFVPAAQILENPVRAVLNASPLTAILFIVVAVLGVIAQIKQNQNFNIDSYDRWATPGAV